MHESHYGVLRRWHLLPVLLAMGSLLPTFVEAEPIPQETNTAEAPQLTFQALWSTTGIDYREAFGLTRSRGEVTLAYFNAKGPLAASSIPLPDDLIDVALDPDRPTYYGMKSRDIVAIDPATLKEESIGLPPNQEMTVQSITFDTKRKRLLVSSQNADRLFAYSPATRQWTELKEAGALAMAYDKKEDVLYMFARPFFAKQGTHCVERCTPDGVSVKKLILSNPPVDSPTLGVSPYAARPSPFHTQPLQLKLVEGRFVFITMIDRRPFAEGIPRIHIYNRETGELQYKGELEVQVEHVEFTSEELHKLYQQLALPDRRAASVAMWRIAGGGDTVLKPLERLTETAQPIQEYRTTLILERIDTLPAKELLKKWAANKARPDRGNAASAALQRMKESDKQARQWRRYERELQKGNQ